jgi:hypothetical protein
MADIFSESDMDKGMAETLSQMNEGSSPASPPAVQEGTASPPSPTAGAASAPIPTPNEWDAFPKQWKKDYEQDWGKLDGRVKQYVHQREKESYDAFNMFKQAADKWTNTLKPYEQAFKQLGIDPHQAFSSVANNHMMLRYGTPEQRRSTYERLVKDYNLQEFMQPGQPQLPVELLKRVDQIENSIQRRAVQEAEQEVEKFFSNPENEFAKDVAAEINRVLETGMATSLSQAYELAIWQNPGVRAKLMEREAQKIAGNRPPSPRDIRSSNTPPAPTSGNGTSGTIDETMAATYAAIQNRS